ncbi:DUF6473 family protein [Gemmobacter nectariphilus]|uniref:DUF6473 family protein n=1 Tax=Gemmobacter nectariphilus TaxID=220343 RepID=UPI000400ACE4|nr:DUF6473 family protein [Gemmobacter nectariphilus]
MTYEVPGAGALDYFPCRYGQSRLVFRGPWRDPAAATAVALGAEETYGRFVARPWPERLEQASGQMVLNMGVPSAGPDAWLHEPALLRIAAGARLRIVQVPGAVNLSNPLYSVHPRRNDRFLSASPRLQRLYPEIDFMDFAFTRHMIRALAARGAHRFAEVAQVLGETWLDRMGAVLEALGPRTVLLWFADRRAPLPGERLRLAPGAPLLVDTMMLQALRPRVAGLVEVVERDFFGSSEGKEFGPLEEAAARALPGADAHEAAARALLRWVPKQKGAPKGAP